MRVIHNVVQGNCGKVGKKLSASRDAKQISTTLNRVTFGIPVNPISKGICPPTNGILLVVFPCLVAKGVGSSAHSISGGIISIGFVSKRI